jgi:hypothetical protein
VGLTILRDKTTMLGNITNCIEKGERLLATFPLYSVKLRGFVAAVTRISIPQQKRNSSPAE